MKKRILSLIMVLVLSIALVSTVASVKTDVSVVIDNKPVLFTDGDGAPFIDENGRTLVPLRVVMESFGCIVQWDQNTQTAYVVKDGVTVTIVIGQKYIRVNGMSQAIDTAAVNKDGRTYLPIRAVLEAFGATVEWDDSSRSVLVTSPPSDQTGPVDGKDGKDGVDGKDGKDGVDGKDGKDGADGVSVANARIDENGSLIVTLSDGTEIDAGKVNAPQTNHKTFESYDIGTKFYLEYPSGEFDIPYTKNDVLYKVHFSEVYYELIAKRQVSDQDAWNGHYFVPYVVNFHLQGSTSPDLAGCSFYVVFNDADTYTSIGFSITVSDDGSFETDLQQGVGDNHFPWYAPRTLCLERFMGE